MWSGPAAPTDSSAGRARLQGRRGPCGCGFVSSTLPLRVPPPRKRRGCPEVLLRFYHRAQQEALQEGLLWTPLLGRPLDRWRR